MSVSPTESRGLFQWCLLASWGASRCDSTHEVLRRIDSHAEMVEMVRVRLILVGPGKMCFPLAPGCAPLVVERVSEGETERNVIERRKGGGQGPVDRGRGASAAENRRSGAGSKCARAST